MTSHGTSVPTRALGVAVAALAAAVALSACSSSSGGGGSSSDSPSAPASSGAPGGTGGAGAPGQGGPAASGTVAAISGTTMQVQNQQTGQVAVAWSASTKFSHQVTTTLTAVKAGDCVTAIAPSGTDAAATSFTATTLTVSTAVDGTCGAGAGRGGGGGQRPSGFPSGQRPSGFPSGGASGRPNFGAIAGGKVTSVSGSTLVIAARQFGQNSSNSTATTNKSVTVGATTKITTEASTTSTSVQVGKCVTAQGKADSSGTVAATTVRITDPTNGQCATGFGGGANGG